MVDQINPPPVGGPYELAVIQIDPDSEKKSKSRKNRKTDKESKIASFDFFCVMSLITSIMIIFVDILKHQTNTDYLIPKSCPEQDARSKNFRNLYDVDFSFDFHAFLNENEANIDQQSVLIWAKQNLTYGDLQSTFSFSTNVSISEVGYGINRPIDELKINDQLFLFSASGATAVFICTSI